MSDTPLTAEADWLADLRKIAGRNQRTALVTTQELRELIGRLDRAEKDAARYRNLRAWLPTSNKRVTDMYGIVRRIVEVTDGEELDAIIDAARSQ